MVALAITVSGDKAAVQYLAKVREGAQEVHTTRILIGTPVDYGVYQERGTLRMRAHPYLAPAAVEVAPTIAGRLVRAIPEGRAAVATEMLGAGHDAQRVAQRRVRVRSGNLRQSIYVSRTGRA
jgi:hypothetical protein